MLEILDVLAGERITVVCKKTKTGEMTRRDEYESKTIFSCCYNFVASFSDSDSCGG